MGRKEAKATRKRLKGDEEKELEMMSGYVEEPDLSKSPMNLSGQPTKVYLNILLMRISNIDTVSASATIKIKVYCFRQPLLAKDERFLLL